MANRTAIEWTDATWTPVKGCTRASEGCRNCYAEIMAARFSDPGQWGEGLATIVNAPQGKDHRWTGIARFDAAELQKPLSWRKPRRIFVCSTSDLFQDSVPDEWIDQVFAVMALCPQHTFQVLTKRADRMREYMTHHLTGFRIRNEMQKICAQAIIHMSWPLPNVWLGVSVEDQQRADERIPDLLATPAAVRWLSCEPLLGPVDLTSLTLSTCTNKFDALRGMTWAKCPDRYGDGGRLYNGASERPKLDWVVVGGESGHGARPMHPQWAWSLRDQCAEARVPFFFKQWGEWAPVCVIPDTDEMDEFLFDKPKVIEGHRRSKVDQCILWANGRRFEMDRWHRVYGEDPANGLFAHAARSGHMLMMKIGKKRAGCLLDRDGAEHNGMPA